MTDPQGRPGAAEVYRRSFARLCAGTVDGVLADLGPPASGRLLDAGCGTGNVARAASALGWTVTAFDTDERMLAGARAEGGHLPIGWVRAALPGSGLATATFDAVVANFVVNNVTDPLGAVTELARVVRPDGVVALTAWVSARTTHITLITEAFRAASLPLPAGDRPVGSDFERTADGLVALARRTGLRPILSRELAWDWTVTWDDLWMGLAALMGPPFEALDPLVRDRVRHLMRRRTRSVEVDGRIRVPTLAAYVLARPTPAG